MTPTSTYSADGKVQLFSGDSAASESRVAAHFL
jgi:hypothetical protein